MEVDSNARASADNDKDYSEGSMENACGSRTAPPSDGSGSRRNGWSPRVIAYNCVACYQRKTKCDRRVEGCSNCSKAGSPCTYPSYRDAAPRKRGTYNKDAVRKNQELEQKVIALETIVHELGKQLQDRSVEVAQKNTDSRYSPTYGHAQGIPTPQEDLPFVMESPRSRDGGNEPTNSCLTNRGSLTGATFSTLPNISWVDFVNKFEASAHDGDYVPVHEKNDHSHDSITSHCNGLMMSTSDTPFRSRLHPDSQTRREYWNIFKERVDPLLKILHIPTFEKHLFGMKEIPDENAIGMDALLFSIYYAAIVNSPLVQPQNQQCTSESRESRLKTYGSAIKQKLAEPDVLASLDIVPLQALTIYLYHTVTDDDQSKYLLTGTALRMAQYLGLHREETALQHSPFEIEMRHRLWWNIHRLERRLAENCISNPFAFEPQSDALLPSNVNDSDISPRDTSPPIPRIGRTEMTFCLADFRFSSLTFAVLKMQASMGSAMCEQKVNVIRETLKELTEEHLQFCDPANDFDFMIITYAKLSVSRIWLIAHQHSRQCLEQILTEPLLDTSIDNEPLIRNLLPLALETFEYAQALSKEPRIAMWSWFWNFPNDVYGHLELSLLAEICYMPSDPLIKRAQTALDEPPTKLRHPTGLISDVTKGPIDPLEAMRNKLRARATELKHRKKPVSNSLQSPPNKMQCSLRSATSTRLDGQHLNSWNGAKEAFFPKASESMVLGSPLMPSKIKYPGISPINMSKSDDMNLDQSSSNTNRIRTGPTRVYQQVSTPFGCMSSLSSGEDMAITPGFMSPSHLTPSLHDAHMNEFPCFQLPNEFMGAEVEGITDSRWDDMMKDLLCYGDV